MRHANANEHTWTIENEKLLEWCEFVAKGEIDYEKYMPLLVIKDRRKPFFCMYEKFSCKLCIIHVLLNRYIKKKDGNEWKI